MEQLAALQQLLYQEHVVVVLVDFEGPDHALVVHAAQDLDLFDEGELKGEASDKMQSTLSVS